MAQYGGNEGYYDPANQGGGGGGTNPPPAGGDIPGAGLYLQDQAQAQHAYDLAMHQINQRRGAMYSEFGLLPSGQVDPYSTHGRYQQMLGAEAGQTHQAEMAAKARGFGGGLGNRVMSRVRQAQGNEQFQFQSDLSNQLLGFSQEEQNASLAKDQAMLDAQHSAADRALQAQNFTPAGADDGSQQSPPPATARPAHGARVRLAQHLAQQRARARARRH